MAASAWSRSGAAVGRARAPAGTAATARGTGCTPDWMTLSTTTATAMQRAREPGEDTGRTRAAISGTGIADAFPASQPEGDSRSMRVAAPGHRTDRADSAFRGAKSGRAGAAIRKGEIL